MPDLSLERAFGGIVAGTDEAGRGPIMGPVTAACVHVPEGASFIGIVNDSKKMSATARARAEALILAEAPYGIGEASVEEILELNILKASMLAMRRAVEAMMAKGRVPHLVLVDGNKAPEIPGVATRTVVGGDAKSISIAAASILAKEHRDRLIARLALAYPGYGWERNAGYPTAEHLAALKSLGVTPHHRTGFGPVRAAIAAG